MNEEQLDKYLMTWEGSIESLRQDLHKVKLLYKYVPNINMAINLLRHNRKLDVLKVIYEIIKDVKETYPKYLTYYNLEEIKEKIDNWGKENVN